MLSNEWQTAHRSGDSGNCGQVRRAGDGMIEVRNSTEPDATPTRFTPAEWEAFVGSVQDGQFDLR